MAFPMHHSGWSDKAREAARIARFGKGSKKGRSGKRGGYPDAPTWSPSDLSASGKAQYNRQRKLEGGM